MDPIRRSDQDPRLEEVDTMLRIQLHNCLLPIAGYTRAMPVTSRLASTVLGHDFFNHDIEQLLHGPTDVRLGGLGVNLKRVMVIPGRSVHALFRYQGTNNHLVGLKLKTFDCLFVLAHDLLPSAIQTCRGP